jgi:hypothetical protein
MSFPKDKMELIYSDERLHADDVAFLKKLVYPREGVMKFSDYEMLMNKIPMGQRRIAMAQVLSQLPATVPSLRIRPDSDIDQIASYWGRMENVHFSKLRPLLESLKKLPNGGTISLVHLLPPFARERLFTYPVSQPGGPIIDCHWTSYNFSNLQPDSRFNNQEYANQYFRNNFDETQGPAAYGDIVVLVNEMMNGLHSGVYLAGDLVFTKYGNNNAQPWMIVHLSDMQTMYPTSKPIYMRKKT